MLKQVLAAGAISFGLLAAPIAGAQTLFKPVAVVNDSAITGFDLAQRAQIMVALGFPAASPDALRSEALNQLVEDRLKLQAGKQIGIAASASLLETGVAEFARRGGITPVEFQTLMNAQGVTDQALEDMVVAEMVWLQVIRARFASRIEPGEAEIDAELGLLAQRDASTFKIIEIGLPMDADGRTEAQTRALAEQLYVSLNQGGDFAKAVAQYSRAPSAARGGDVGWISTERMPPNLLQALAELEVGSVSRPLQVAGGFSLLKLIDKKVDTTTRSVDPALREQVRNRLVNLQSARLADGLLQEMRRDALIEVR